jgi:hypothetical protein
MCRTRARSPSFFVIVWRATERAGKLLPLKHTRRCNLCQLDSHEFQGPSPPRVADHERSPLATCGPSTRWAKEVGAGPICSLTRGAAGDWGPYRPIIDGACGSSTHWRPKTDTPQKLDAFSSGPRDQYLLRVAGSHSTIAYSDAVTTKTVSV